MRLIRRDDMAADMEAGRPWRLRCETGVVVGSSTKFSATLVDPDGREYGTAGVVRLLAVGPDNADPRVPNPPMPADLPPPDAHWERPGGGIDLWGLAAVRLWIESRTDRPLTVVARE